MSSYPRSEALAERFHPVFDRIAEHAAQRDNQRVLAFDAVAWLREAGFGALRVPVAYGGLGASVEQLFDQLIALGTADSNLPQIWRAHFGFIERLLANTNLEPHAPWLREAASGTVFGNATTEKGNGVGAVQTRLVRDADGDGWLLDGDKFYSTGTLYADWISVTAERVQPSTGATAVSDRVAVLVDARSDGVERLDDWDGFGQRLTASGTTRFSRVRVQPEHVYPYSLEGPTTHTAMLQLVHLASLAGIAHAIVRDAVAFVQPRTRIFSHGSAAIPREDPLVQQVVGQLASAAFIATAAVQSVSSLLGDIDRLRQREASVPESLVTEVELRAAKAQVAVADTVLGAAARLFDVGGASALQESRRLDRHWRNARTLASHNPTIYKARAIGDHALNGTRPTFFWVVGASGG